MPFSQPAVRRRAPGRNLFAILGAIACMAAPHNQVTAQTQTEVELAVDTIPDDTSSVHKVLRKRIAAFEDEWRKEWKKTQNNRQANGARMVRSNVVATSGSYYRRTASFQCYFTPSRRLEFSPLLHPIVTSPDRGVVCPLWLSPDEVAPPDESRKIDRALQYLALNPIHALRERLIKQLEAAQRQFPYDTWIAGERVRFVHDQGVPEHTLETAKSCRGDTRVCASLIGFALEQLGDIGGAEAEFRRADALIAATPHDKQGCMDADQLALFNAADRRRIKHESCAQQAELVNRMWWLADPLWSVPGNDRFVAHNSRRTLVALRSVNDRDERYVWWRYAGGVALREMVVRYGWPSYTYWAGGPEENRIAQAMDPPPRIQTFHLSGGRIATRVTSGNPHLDPIKIVAFPFSTKEYSADRTALLPATDAVFDPFNLNASHWNLRPPVGKDPDLWWPQEHLQLNIMLAPLNGGQDVMWRRDSNVTYHLAIDDPLVALDSTARGLSAVKMMGGSADSSTRELANTAIGKGHTLRLNTALASTPVVLSVEVLPRTEKEPARRARYGVRPPPTLREMTATDVALADPVFMRMPNKTLDVPVDEESVLRYMAGGVTFTKTEPIALYWESYGFIPGDTVQVELRVRRDDDVNVVRRVGSVFGLGASLRDSVSMRWTEPSAGHATKTLAGSRPVTGRAVGLDLGALPAGKYVVTIEMRKGTNISARSSRSIVITDP